jgi:hypothetical protein
MRYAFGLCCEIWHHLGVAVHMGSSGGLACEIRARKLEALARQAQEPAGQDMIATRRDEG